MLSRYKEENALDNSATHEEVITAGKAWIQGTEDFFRTYCRMTGRSTNSLEILVDASIKGTTVERSVVLNRAENALSKLEKLQGALDATERGDTTYPADSSYGPIRSYHHRAHLLASSYRKQEAAILLHDEGKAAAAKAVWNEVW